MEDASTLFAYCGMEKPFTGYGGGNSAESTWTLFGQSRRTIYRCNLASLLKSETFFYDLFFQDPETLQLYPVPVRNVNYGGLEAVNPLYVENLCENTDVLTRRFFLFDSISGVPADGSSVEPT